MLSERLYLFFVTVLWCIGIAFVVWSIPAYSQEHTGHPPEHMALHDQFYTNWNRPDMRDTPDGERKYSCCNNTDCAPVDRIEYRADGTVWALRTKDQQWVKIPEGKIESNQIDPRESPDGRSHMCSSGSTVFCFVLGSAT